MPRHSASARSRRRTGANARPGYPQPDRHGQIAGAVLEQRRLLGLTDQPCRSTVPRKPAVFIELAEMRHRLLDDSPTDPNAAHQRQ